MLPGSYISDNSCSARAVYISSLFKLPHNSLHFVVLNVVLQYFSYAILSTEQHRIISYHVNVWEFIFQNIWSIAFRCVLKAYHTSILMCLPTRATSPAQISIQCSIESESEIRIRNVVFDQKKIYICSYNLLLLRLVRETLLKVRKWPLTGGPPFN